MPSVCEGRGVFNVHVDGLRRRKGSRTDAVSLIRKHFIMRTGRDKERRRAVQLKVQIDCGWRRFPASPLPLFSFCNISYLSLRAVTHTPRAHTGDLAYFDVTDSINKKMEW